MSTILTDDKDGDERDVDRVCPSEVSVVEAVEAGCLDDQKELRVPRSGGGRVVRVCFERPCSRPVGVDSAPGIVRDGEDVICELERVARC